VVCAAFVPGHSGGDRYDIRQSLGKGGMGEVFLAFDRSTQQTVALKVVREESRMPGDDEALRQELLLARSVSHPNVCRVHDLCAQPLGPHPGDGEHPRPDAAHAHPRKKAQGGYTSEEFRKIAAEVCAGLAAIHAQGLVHGDLKPGNVMVTEEKAVILDFGFAQERARAAARRVGAPPDGGTPNYMSPERLKQRRRQRRRRRLRDGPHALGNVDLPRARARLPPARQADAAADHVRRPERALDRRGASRSSAACRRSGHAAAGAAHAVLQPVAAHDQPHPAPARAARSRPSLPAARRRTLLARRSGDARHVRHERDGGRGPAPPADEERHDARPPHRPRHRRSRRPPSPARHASLRWQNGSWLIEDLGSTNGSYADFSYERKSQVSVMHGGEAQVGECRLKLVSFQIDSAAPQARAPVPREARRPHRPLVREHLLKAIDEEAAFADWARCRSRWRATSCAGPTGRSAIGRPSSRCSPCAAPLSA
jgi:serine/threonine protein kinase